MRQDAHDRDRAEAFEAQAFVGNRFNRFENAAVRAVMAPTEVAASFAQAEAMRLEWAEECERQVLREELLLAQAEDAKRDEWERIRKVSREAPGGWVKDGEW